MTNDEKLALRDVIELYQLRWQIELFFKELKSTLGLHHYRFKEFDKVETWVTLCLVTFTRGGKVAYTEIERMISFDVVETGSSLFTRGCVDRGRADAGPARASFRRGIGRVLREEGPAAAGQQLLQLPFRRHQLQGRPARRRPQRPAPRAATAGPAVVPGDPEKSLLIQAVRQTDDDLKMPPKKQLSARGDRRPDAVDQGRRGLAGGGRAGRRSASPTRSTRSCARSTGPGSRSNETQASRRCATPPGRATTSTASSWRSSKRRGSSRSATRTSSTLIRRVTFDLTGLPPTPEEIDAFLADDSSDAFAKVVDRLLASPAFGERWGRHWLDVARYGESTGSSRNLRFPTPGAIATTSSTRSTTTSRTTSSSASRSPATCCPASSPSERDEQLIATGFLALGVKDVNQRFKVRFVMDNIDEQIDAVSRSVLAPTASCARCHDHKFDPIPTTDYYALAGIFHSTDLCAGVRNKMGGGGLDYYDTAMLVRLGPEAKPDPQTRREDRGGDQGLRGGQEGVRGDPRHARRAGQGGPTASRSSGRSG